MCFVSSVWISKFKERFRYLTDRSFAKSKSSCSMAKYLTHLFLQLESINRFTFQQAVVVVVDRSLESEILHGLYRNEKYIIAASLSCSLFGYLARRSFAKRKSKL